MGIEKKHIVLGVTGSIAAYKSADLIRRLGDGGATVSVIMTKEARQFITPLTLSSLSGQKVYGDLFEDWGRDGPMSHIQLARDADAIVVAPATANVIAKLAHGLADDLLTCTVLATRAPVVVAPAMNEGMFQNKIVQENCRTLKECGFVFVNPVKGQLACGVYGEGHLAEVETIVSVLGSVFR